MRTLLVLTVLGGGVAHATVAPALGIAGVTPDLPLIVVVLLALRRGPEFGCAAGFAAGLLQDAAGRGLSPDHAPPKPPRPLLLRPPGGGPRPPTRPRPPRPALHAPPPARA